MASPTSLGASLALAFASGALPEARADDAPLPRVQVEAVVDDDLRTVRGTVRWQGDLAFVDALGRLPDPPDDRSALRTWPGAPEHGAVTWRVRTDERGPRLEFTTTLPDRYDASGRVPGRGLFASGLWVPQPVTGGGGVPVVAWSAEVALPAGAAGALGSSAGAGVLRWEGRGERVGLAVVPGGTVERVGTVTVLSRRGLSRGRARWLARSLPAGEGLPLAVVDAPLMRRLVRPAPGLLFLSSRAFRLTPGLRHLHLPAVTRGALEAGLAQALPDPDARALAAAVRARAVLAAAPTAQGLLRWFSWVPQVDELLYGGSTPYVAEVMREPWPGDPVEDDLLELLDPRLPGPVRLGRAEARGLQATADGSPGAVPPADQDYRLRVLGRRVEVERRAPIDAPPEPVVVQIGDRRLLWEAGAGPGTWTAELPEEPGRVRLDPDGLLRQRDRGQETWPRRWTTVFSFNPVVWDVSAGRVEGYVAARLRRQHDTRWRFDTYVFRDAVDAVGLKLAAGYALGPLQDRRWRPVRLTGWGSAALLDPGFAAAEGGAAALDLGATLLWDTQVDWLFPLRGHTASLAVRGGLLPGGAERWAGLSGSLGGIASPHPRVAVAGEVLGGMARSGVDQRFEVLGGVDSLRSVPADLLVGTGRLAARGEVRGAPLRHVSVPLALAWLDELQVTAGLEAGLLGGARADPAAGRLPADGWARVAGATAGTFAVLDVLGGAPLLVGAVAGFPLAADPTWAADRGPQLYLLAEQAI